MHAFQGMGPLEGADGRLGFAQQQLRLPQGRHHAIADIGGQGGVDLAMGQQVVDAGGQGLGLGHVAQHHRHDGGIDAVAGIAADGEGAQKQLPAMFQVRARPRGQPRLAEDAGQGVIGLGVGIGFQLLAAHHFHGLGQFGHGFQGVVGMALVQGQHRPLQR